MDHFPQENGGLIDNNQTNSVAASWQNDVDLIHQKNDFTGNMSSIPQEPVPILGHHPNTHGGEDQHFSNASNVMNQFEPQAQGLSSPYVEQGTSMMEIQQQQLENNNKIHSTDISLGNYANPAAFPALYAKVPHLNHASNGAYQPTPPQEAPNPQVQFSNSNFNEINQFQPPAPYLSHTSNEIDQFQPDAQVWARENFVQQTSMMEIQQQHLKNSHEIHRTDICLGNSEYQRVFAAQHENPKHFNNASRGALQLQPQGSLNPPVQYINNGLNQFQSEAQHCSNASSEMYQFQQQYPHRHNVSNGIDQFTPQAQRLSQTISRAQTAKGQHLNNTPNGASRFQPQLQGRNSEVRFDNASNRAVQFHPDQLQAQSQVFQYPDTYRNVLQQLTAQGYAPTACSDPSRIHVNDGHQVKANSYGRNGLDPSASVFHNNASFSVQPTPSVNLQRSVNGFNGNLQPQTSQGTSNLVSPLENNKDNTELNLLDCINKGDIHEGSGPHTRISRNSNGDMNCSLGLNADNFQEQSVLTKSVQVPTRGIPPQACSAPQRSTKKPKNQSGMITIRVPSFITKVPMSKPTSEWKEVILKNFSSYLDNMEVNLNIPDTVIIETKREEHTDDDLTDVKQNNILKRKHVQAAAEDEFPLLTDMDYLTSHEILEDDAKEQTSLSNHMQPRTPIPFTIQELDRLVTAVESNKAKVIRWLDIQKNHFPNRSPNELKDKYKGLVKSSAVSAENRRGDDGTDCILERVKAMEQLKIAKKKPINHITRKPGK